MLDAQQARSGHAGLVRARQCAWRALRRRRAASGNREAIQVPPPESRVASCRALTSSSSSVDDLYGSNCRIDDGDARVLDIRREAQAQAVYSLIVC